MEGTARAPMNVREGISLTDTIQIGENVVQPAGYPSYRALAALEEIPFFTIRNRTEVGLAYTNKDSKDSLAYPLRIKDIGIHFHAMPPYHTLPVAEGASTPADIAEFNAGRLFESEIPYHCGFILKVKEDERLAHTVEYAPPGAGSFGYTAGAAPERVQSFNMGWPSMGNRFGFREEIDVPRNAVVSVVLKLSPYAKELLANMPGPLADLLLCNTATPPTTVKARRLSIIRVTLNGAREVQQRGEYHY